MQLKCPGLVTEALNLVVFADLPSSKRYPLAVPGSAVQLGWLMLLVPFRSLSGAHRSCACQPHSYPRPACRRLFSGFQSPFTGRGGEWAGWKGVGQARGGSSPQPHTKGKGACKYPSSLAPWSE